LLWSRPACGRSTASVTGHLFGFLLPMFAPWIPIINRTPR
jgi:hypothetical protein